MSEVAAAVTTQTPAPTETPAPAPTTETSSSWTSALSEDLRGYVQTKGFKDPAAVLDGYRSLEKLHGVPKERIVKLPEKADDAEGWAQVYTKMGRPAKPEEYSIPKPEKGQTDEEFTKSVKGMFYEAGLGAAQAEKLAKSWNTYFQTKAEQMEAANKTKLETEAASLKKDWGAAYEQNVRIADVVADELKISNTELDAFKAVMGPAKALKFLHSLSEKIGEAKFVDGSTRVNAPAGAMNQIKSLSEDKAFVQRLFNGDVAAREQWDRLHKQAHPEVAAN